MVTSTHNRAADDPLALEQQVCFALAVASRTVISVYRPVLEPLGLTHPQYLVMLALWGAEPLSLTELSRMLELDAGTLSRLLEAARGCWSRTPRPQPDRRAEPGRRADRAGSRSA